MANSFDAARKPENSTSERPKSTKKLFQDSGLLDAKENRVQLIEQSRRTQSSSVPLFLTHDSLLLIDASGRDVTDKPSIASKLKLSIEQQPLLQDKQTSVTERHTAAAVRKERENLLSLAKAHRYNTNEFAKRMDEFEARVPKDITVADVADTYKSVSRLLDEHSKTPPLTSLDERLALARQILAQAAEPGIISQGMHNTCSVASIESVVYTRHPEKAAAMLADLALTGKFTGAYGTQLQMNPHPKDFQGKDYSVMRDGERSYASELFQLAAVNLLYRELPKQGDLRYEQSYVPSEKHSQETGEGLYKYDSGKREKVANNPLILPFAYRDVEYGITGIEEKTSLLGNAKYLKPVSKELECLSDSVAMFTSEEDLEKQLADIKARKGFPVIISVNTGNEPFVHDNPASAALPGNQHAVTIRDYLPGDPSKVLFNNEWHRKDNHDTLQTAVTVHELYLSTFTPKDSSELLQRDIFHSNKFGQPDRCAELEELRLRWISGNLNNEDFTSRTIREWEKILGDVRHHKLTEVAIKRSGEQIETIVQALPMHDSMRLVEKFNESGAYTQKDLAEIVRTYAVDVVHRIEKGDFRQCLELADDYMRLLRLKYELPEQSRQRIDNAVIAEMARNHQGSKKQKQQGDP
ncbi:MAG TPA: hypothetical protein V6C97_33945 [Oculatellaceae cyanobacterium]